MPALLDSTRLITLASRIYSAESLAQSQLDESYRLALFRGEGAASPAWGLALLLACWNAEQAGQSLDELASTGVLPLLSQIKTFEGWFPSSFPKFLQAAQRGGDPGSIAAASSYFVTTLKDLGSIARPGFLSWLASPKFAGVAGALTRRFGGPATAGPVRSRTREFDHADYGASSALVRARQTQPAAPAPILVNSAPAQHDMLLASLVNAGWDPDQAAQILMGPSQPPQPPANLGPRPFPNPDTVYARPKNTGTQGGAGQRLPPRSSGNGGTPKQSDAGGIPGAVKSGIDLARDILKQATSQPKQGGSGTKGAPKGTPSKTSIEEDIEQSIADDSTDDILTQDALPDAGGATPGSSDAPPDIIDDSSQVID